MSSATQRPLISRPSSIGGGEPVLSRTFVHLSGVGSITERRFWDDGVLTWGDLKGARIARRPGVRAVLEASEAALQEGDLDFFHRALPPRERWRSFTEPGRRHAAIDVETTGLSIYDAVTAIGVEVDGEYRSFVKGVNLDEAEDALAGIDGVITFNGTLFDLPFLRRALPGLRLPAAHLDLRFAARRAGLTGPLKDVELAAGLKRSRKLKDVDGFEATVLWSEYQHGRDSSLARLLRYNSADTLVLRPLAALCLHRLRVQLDGPSSLRPQRPVPGRRLPAAPRIGTRDDRLNVGPRSWAIPPRSTTPVVTLGDLHARMPDRTARIVGVDLTGSEQRPSGWALLEGDLVLTGRVKTTAELVALTVAAKPSVVSIDSPLSLPNGRCCADDACACRAVGGIVREAERELRRRGINAYPALIPSMQALTKRGILLARELQSAGVKVIESYPGAAQDIMHIPRKRASQDQLAAGLGRFGVRGLRATGAVSHDELDATTSAVVGAFYLAEAFSALGSPDENDLIVPSLLGLESTAGASSPYCPAPRRIVLGPGAHLVSGMRDSGEADGPASVFEAISRHGAAARMAIVERPGTRVPRRPSFADLHLAAGDRRASSALAAWKRRWAA